MKTKHLLTTLAIIAVFFSFNKKDQITVEENHTPSNLRSVDNKAYQSGEVLKYRLHYGIINAGTARLEVKKLEKKIGGREIYHMVGTGKTASTFDLFFKVRDRYETYMDVEGAFPWVFVRNVNEGGYKINQKYKFMQKQKKIDNGKGKTFDAPEGIQDMLSAFYYARTIDFSNAKVGEIFTIWSFVDDELWPLKIKYAGKETIKVNRKKYKAIKFHPVIQSGRLFKNEDDVNIWISDDENKIPLLAQAKVLIGSIKMELTGTKGLANPTSEIE